MRKLSISDWGSIADVISAVAVVVSLIYLAMEVHRNTVTNIQSSTQALITDINRSYEAIAQDSELASIYQRGTVDFSSLSADEKVRFSAFLMMSLRSLEDLHAQWRKGLVDQGIWTGFDRQMSEVVQAPGMKQWWSIRRQFFNDEFQALIDAKMAATSDAETTSLGQLD